MKIVAVVRQVLDAEESVRVRNGKVDVSSSKLVMDTMDEYGVEQALRLKESGEDIEVVLLAVGPSRSEEALRAGLALGADRAILVETEKPLDVVTISGVIAGVASREGAQLIVCGGQQADWDSQGLGPAVAERLNWPQATWTKALQLHEQLLTGTHDVDDGSESFVVSLPAVVTTQQGLNEPRYPTLPNIMKARRKELQKQMLDSVSATPKVQVVHAEVQSKSRLGRIVEGKEPGEAAAQLVSFLRNEAKVIP